MFHACRKSLPQPRLKDEVLEEEQRRVRSEKFQSFRLIWDNILEQRKQEKTARRDMMKRQLETYIGFQVCDVFILLLHWAY